eukprot:jgi/Psemu1/24722/gm1.24722_g
MAIIPRSHIVVTALGIAGILSLFRNFLSTRRILTSTNEFYTRHDGSIVVADAPFVGSSKLHYMRDEQLDTRYSTTHQKIRGQFSLILNDNDETHTGNNDFQHKGILRKSSDKQGKWMSIRHTSAGKTFDVAGETIRRVGTNYSKFVDDMRFEIITNHTIISPNLAAKNDASNYMSDNHHLCHVLRVMTVQNTLKDVPDREIPPVALNINADCSVMNEKLNGQGNTVLALYGVRMISALSKVDFEFQCTSSNSEVDNNHENRNDYKKEKERKLRWVFPWFASYQTAVDSREHWPYRGDAPTEDEVCSSSNSNLDNAGNKMPLEKMADLIRDDVRKMSLQLIGSRTDVLKRTHPLVPLDADPWIHDIRVDDVIIHFPCYNDVYDMEFATIRRRNRVGILHFSEYTKHIRDDIKSIGIIAESPRKVGDTRNGEISGLYIYDHAITLLVEYLQAYFSNQRVDVSIYDNDTLPLQYARIAMAKQSFSSFSTFGMIPIIGTFGEGYFQPTISNTGGIVGGQNKIIRRLVSNQYDGFDNIHLMNGKVLSPKNISTMNLNDLSEWLSK